MVDELKTWLERIESNRFDEWTEFFLLQEAPRTRFKGPFPPELAFLDGGWVDLGFENLGYNQKQQHDLLRAFSGNGVVVPGTSHRLRFAYPHAVIEPMRGNEQDTLPHGWKQAVLVTDNQFVPTWVGHKTRPDQRAGFNLQGYVDVGDGLVPPNP